MPPKPLLRENNSTIALSPLLHNLTIYIPMKNTILIFPIWLWLFSYSYAQDTVKIVLDNETKLLITSPDRASLLKLRYLDINHLIRDAIRQKNGDAPPTREHEPDNYRNNRWTYRLNYDNTERNNRRRTQDSIKRARGWDSHNAWDFSFGNVNYLEKGKFPNNANKPYGLNTHDIGFTYLSIASNFILTFNNSPFNLSIGAELSSLNFRFQNNNYIVRNTTGDSIKFRNYDFDFQKSLSRTKLNVVYLNIPIQFRFALLRNIAKTKKIMELDFGGSVGYRLTSSSRIRVSGERRTSRTSDDYLLNNWRYGAEAGLSIHGIRLFGRYDFSKLFANAQMPDLNVLTIGVKVMTLD